MSLKKSAFAWYSFVFLFAAVLPVSAQIVLKPNGQNAAPLRVKVISANITVEGAVATTRQTLIFQNETSDRIEADFLYTLPLNTVVTYFAYWYGDEKVVAKIMEKERAAAIYAHITSRMRDPALIEMVGKNTFRARIFPIMPNADLKVEMHLVTVVPTDTHHLSYTYPFPAQSNSLPQTDAGPKPTIDKPKSREKLDSMDVRVVFRKPTHLLDIKTNYGELERKDADGYTRFWLHGKRYQPPKDLRVTARRTPQPLQADLTSARISGQDGYFTLVLATDKPLIQPQVQISGVTTSEVYTQGDKTNSRIFRLFGRYRGSGKATVILNGVSSGQPISYTAPIVFEGKTIQNHAASKLWAATKIEKLTAANGSRSTITALSKRYNMPSKYTSWLAVPKAEMERYEQEMLNAEIQVVANNLAYLIARKQGKTPAAKRFRAELNRLCQRSEYQQSPESALSQALWQVVNSTAQALAEEIKTKRGQSAKAKRLRAELNDLTKQTGEDVKSLLRSHLYNEMERTTQGLADEIVAERGRTAKAKRLREELNYLAKQTGQNVKDLMDSHLYSAAYRIVNEYAREIIAYSEPTAKARQLRARIESYAQQAGIESKEILESTLGHLIHNLSEDILRAETGFGYYSPTRSQDGDYYPDYTTTQPNPAFAKQKRLELQRLARAIGVSPEGYLRNGEYQRNTRRTFEVREQIIAERRSAKPDWDKIRKLEAEFTRLNGGKEYADARTRRLAVKQDLFLLDKQISDRVATPDSALPALTQRRDTLRKEEEALRARMGDPLISVDASANMQQVIAILPGGEIKRLAFNSVRGKWEARFDIPTYATEGKYVITVILVRKDGNRQQLTMDYHVDITPPQGTGTARAVRVPEPTLRLELAASPDTARVTAILPWKETMQMQPSTQKAHAFFALVKLPKGYRAHPSVVTYILTDQAHNRTTITVDLER